MKPVQMSFEEVYAQLEAWGTEKVRAIYARQGAGENQFGVMMGPLRKLAKKLKTNHPLAMQLWATGNADAMILATMLMDSAQLSVPEIEDLLRPLRYIRLIDELVYNVIQYSPHAGALREQWMNSSDELTGRVGWNLMIAQVSREDAPARDYDALLDQIEAEMKAAPKRKQESMNQCMVEIAVRFPEHRQRCIAIGERLGRLDNTPVPKGCTSSYAPEWIAAVLRRTEKVVEV